MPMLSLRRPSTQVLSEFLASQSDLGFTYAPVGATATVPPAGYTVDHTRIKLGVGEEIFARAQAALRRWEHFRLGWMEAWSPETTIETGDVVAIVARNLGLWWLNAARVVYVVDEPGPIRRFGFASGTLPDHAMVGEERFLVEWDQTSGEVWYDILAFSRPHFLLTRLGYPFVRRVQKRFAKASAAAMLRVIGNQAGEGA
jgi:uncharacterized protein (UPF0548 family)